jgi:hypothetical protein
VKKEKLAGDGRGVRSDSFAVKDDAQLLAFWLTPAEPGRGFFHSVVDDLAARYDAPVFEPHLTLFSTGFDHAFDFAPLEQIPMPHEIELKIDSVQHSDRYTKTLFVRFPPSAELMVLRRDLAKAAGQELPEDYDPHVSLIYKEISPNERSDLAGSIEFPFEFVRFDAVKAISSPAKIESGAEVKAWRSLWERKFAK